MEVADGQPETVANGWLGDEDRDREDGEALLLFTLLLSLNDVLQLVLLFRSVPIFTVVRRRSKSILMLLSHHFFSSSGRSASFLSLLSLNLVFS